MDHNIPYNRSRPKGKYKGPPVVHAEDSQPNESIDKRRARDPQALIVTSKRRGYQGRQSNYHQSHSYRNNNNSRYTPNYNNTPRAPPSISHVHPIPPSWNASRAFNTASSSRVPSFTTTHTLTPTATSRDPASPPPAKRRRTNEPVVNIKSESISITSSPAPPFTPAPSIKLEPRTPSPPPLSPPARRQLTSGAKRYFPVPFACTRASASQSQLGAPHDWVAARRAWAHKEAAKLRALGLKVVKFFFRDDGMVIEWVSGDGEPVWADTLRPVNARAGAVAVQEVIDVDGVDTGPPPSPPHTPAVFVRANAQLAHLALQRATSSPPIEVLGRRTDVLRVAHNRLAHANTRLPHPFAHEEEEEQDQLAAYQPATLEDLVAQDGWLAEDVPFARDEEPMGGERMEVRGEEETAEETQDEALHRLAVEFLRRCVLFIFLVDFHPTS
ncbi:hypothetical protein C8R43DRAFT_1003079 [Mycena crocata]|nr:hypothetical protein C8R43DRAFT_1003079 [Mycena crocata]